LQHCECSYCVDVSVLILDLYTYECGKGGKSGSTLLCLRTLF
jgi:hypothetical protein